MEEFATFVVLIVDATLRVATPLILAALGGLFCERSGVVDIALEGKMLGAAFAAAAMAAMSGSAWVGLLFGILFALFLAMIHGYACVTHKGDQVVSGMAINILVAARADPGAGVVQARGPDPRPERRKPLSPDRAAVRRHPGRGAGGRRDLCEILSGHFIIVYFAFAAVPLAAWWSIAPGSGCACAPSAKARRRSTPPASPSTACATRRCS